jgi:L-asparagine transporter-like permease
MLSPALRYLPSVLLVAAVLVFTLVNDMEHKLAFFVANVVVIVIVTVAMTRSRRRTNGSSSRNG